MPNFCHPIGFKPPAVTRVNYPDERIREIILGLEEIRTAIQNDIKFAEYYYITKYELLMELLIYDYDISLLNRDYLPYLYQNQAYILNKITTANAIQTYRDELTKLENNILCKDPNVIKDPNSAIVNYYNKKYHLLMKLLIFGEKISVNDEMFLRTGNPMILLKKNSIANEGLLCGTISPPKRELCLLMSEHDNTFTGVPYIEHEDDRKTMEYFFTWVGLKMDIEKTGIFLSNDEFKRIKDLRFSMEMQEQYLKEYIPSCIKENEFIQKVKSSPQTPNSIFNLFTDASMVTNLSIHKLLKVPSIPNLLDGLNDVHYTNELTFKGIVLINKHNLGTFQVSSTKSSSNVVLGHMREFIKKYEEYGFEILFTFVTKYEKVQTKINELFQGFINENIEELQQKINNAVEVLNSEHGCYDFMYFEMGKKELECFHKLIGQEFHVDTTQCANPHFRARAQDIFNFFERNEAKAQEIYPEFKANISFRNRLSKYLSNQFIKKRQNDGYYYYGIVPKSQCTNITSQCITTTGENVYLHIVK